MTEDELAAIEERAKFRYVPVLGGMLPSIRSKLLIGTDKGVEEIASVDYTTGDVLRLVAEVRRLKAKLEGR